MAGAYFLTPDDKEHVADHLLDCVTNPPPNGKTWFACVQQREVLIEKNLQAEGAEQ